MKKAFLTISLRNGKKKLLPSGSQNLRSLSHAIGFQKTNVLGTTQVHEDGEEEDEKEQDLLEAETWSGAGRRKRRAHREQRASAQRRTETK
jgi:hypothetical protein